MRRHMLDPSPDRGLCGIGAGGGLGHGLSLGLATVDATGQHTIGQPCFVRPRAVCCVGPDLAAAIHCDHRRNMRRSEEHTSELQSLMRISYAVFCLKKKT